MQKINTIGLVMLILLLMNIIIGNVLAVNELNPPGISVDIASRSESSDDINVRVLVLDDTLDPGPSFKYKFTTDTIKPNDGWIEISTQSIIASKGNNGTWYLHIEAEDSSHNKSYKYYGPYIKIGRDTTMPVIKLNGSNEIIVEVGDSYTDEEATVYDNGNEDITERLVITGKDLVDTSAVGDYIIRYNASDVAGNSARQVIRVVHVVESISKYTGYAAFTKSSDRKYFRYYLGLDKRGIAILMLVAPAGDGGVDEPIERDGFGKDKILDGSYHFKNDIYYIDDDGIIKKYTTS